MLLSLGTFCAGRCWRHGHELLNLDEASARLRRCDVLVSRLGTVDWRRGKHWEGIAGKFTPKGAFSVGGSKETAYAVYDALNDETSTGYAQVRVARPAAA